MVKERELFFVTSIVVVFIVAITGLVVSGVGNMREENTAGHAFSLYRPTGGDAAASVKSVEQPVQPEYERPRFKTDPVEHPLEQGSSYPGSDESQFMIKVTGDMLRLDEPVGNVTPNITGEDLGILSTNSFTNQYGAYDCMQALDVKFADAYGEEVLSAMPIYGENRQDVLADYLYLEGSQFFIKYALRFYPSLETRDVQNSLEGLEGKTIEMLGREYEVANAQIIDPSGIRLELVSQGLSIELIDSDLLDEHYYQGVEVDGETIDDARVRIRGFRHSDSVYIRSIEYMLKADNAGGGTDIYVPEGGKLSDFMEESEGLLGNTWDIEYRGLGPAPIGNISVHPTMTGLSIVLDNKDGEHYETAFLSAMPDMNDVILYGGENGFWFTEDQGAYLISEGDSMVVTGSNDVSKILQYSHTDHQLDRIYFLDNDYLKAVAYEGTPGVDAFGWLVIGGHTYKVLVGPYDGNHTNISVDLDGDEHIGDDKVFFIGPGLSEVSFGDQVDLTGQSVGLMAKYGQANIEVRTRGDLLEEPDKDAYFMQTWELDSGSWISDHSSLWINWVNSEFAYSPYGTTYALESIGFTIDHPYQEVEAEVYVTGESGTGSSPLVMKGGSPSIYKVEQMMSDGLG